MPRGGHRHGYNWGVPKKDQTQINVPKEIAEDVKKLAQEFWEQHRQEEGEERSVAK